MACHAANRAQIAPGTRALVMGAGAVGLLCAAAARSRGCTRIIICDIDKERVEFAVKEGFAEAGFISVPRKSVDVEESISHARELASEIGSQVWPDGGAVNRLHVVFECTGVPSIVQTSIFVSLSSDGPVATGF